MTEKKQLLFISSNMGVGGFQKSLISLLQCMDYDRYEVDLLLLNPVGIFMDQIPEAVHLLAPVVPPVYFEKAPAAIWQLLCQKQFHLAMRRLASALVFLVDKGNGALILSRGIPPLGKAYDVAIDNNGQQILYYMTEHVKANRKITFFHSDYKKWPYYKNTDAIFYGKVDAIVTVSDLCVRSMKEIFPQYQDKIYCIENIISEKTVGVFPVGQNGYTDHFYGKRIVTVGRVCRDKGILLAMESCALLKAQGANIRWYWVGPWDNGIRHYCALQKQLGIQNDFVFLGPTSNPYDYMREADLVVHPSYFEGKAVAIEEAKVLGKPVVATNFSTVRNQIEDGKTGLIVELNPPKIADGIRLLLENPGLYAQIEENLRIFRRGNEEEIEKLYRLIEGY